MPHPSMGLRWNSFKEHKEGNSPAEYEDYGDGDPERGRFAIADGAAESSFAKHWAQLLVERFLNEPVCEASQWESWLPPIQKTWCDKVDGMKLSWFAQEKADLGAFATFLGLVVQPDGTWHAVAVGDSCLFHRRAKQFISKTPFPIAHAADFNTTPSLIGARLPADDIARSNKELRLDGKWEKGDCFYLMTDALAQWFLQHREQKKKIPADKHPLHATSPEEFTACVAWLRQQGELRNDDVTLMKIDT